MTTNFKSVESVWSRFGSMINTTLILGSACGFVYAWGQYDAGIRYDIARLEATVIRNAEDVNSYINEHENLVKERFGDNRALAAATDTRIRSTEKSLEDIIRQTDRLDYRITVAESGLATQSINQKSTTDKLNDLIGDVKVIKEVVVRQDASSNPVRKNRSVQ